MERKVIIISDGKIPRVEILKLLAKTKNAHESVPRCKRCSTPHNLLKSGYCIDCDEELESEAK